MWTCEKCKAMNPDKTQECPNCGEKRTCKVEHVEQPQRIQTYTQSVKRRVNSANYDGKPDLSTWLDVFGWILLGGGIVAAIICFSTLAYAENEIVGLLYSRTEKVFSWSGFIISVGVLFSSVFGFLCARGLSQIVWDSSTTKSLTMQMYDKMMNDD